MLRRDGPLVDVLERLPASLVQARMRPVAAHAIHANATLRAGSSGLSAACGLLEDGEKIGGAGDFRFGNEPRSLVGAAYYQLALLVSRKEPVRECEECKRLSYRRTPAR
jgi:hypothetical protein